jgi:signal transduction histidine kinase
VTLTREVTRPGLTVSADRERVFRVISNLVGNAIKFTPEGGSIRLRVDKPDVEVVFSVSDTGPGIAPDLLPHVFSRYWQAKSSGREGAGLGLYIAQGIVQAHGGRIWVESELGRGTTFFFTLRAA